MSDSFQVLFSFFKWKLLQSELNYSEIFSHGSNWQQHNIGSDNGLSPVQRHSFVRYICILRPRLIRCIITHVYLPTCDCTVHLGIASKSLSTILRTAFTGAWRRCWLIKILKAGNRIRECNKVWGIWHYGHDNFVYSSKNIFSMVLKWSTPHLHVKHLVRKFVYVSKFKTIEHNDHITSCQWYVSYKYKIFKCLTWCGMIHNQILKLTCMEFVRYVSLCIITALFCMSRTQSWNGD